MCVPDPSNYFLLGLPDLLLEPLLEGPLPSLLNVLAVFLVFEVPLVERAAVLGFFVQYFSSSESKKPPNFSSLDCCLALIKAFKLSSPPSGMHKCTCVHTISSSNTT